MSVEVLAVADDTSGALEIGAQFVVEGVRSVVAIAPKEGLSAGVDALVVDTATRHLPPADAYGRVHGLACAARGAGVRHIYKKTDSTLRGNIAVEFQALLDAWPEAALVYVPAYPKLGRVVEKGRLLVDGRPLDQTDFARDRLNPSRESSIPALLGGSPVSVAGSGQLAEFLDRARPGQIAVCDGRFDSDLEETASALAGAARPLIVAGTGGFAGLWVQTLPVARLAQTRLPAARRCLVVNGSLHPVSRAQIREAERSGVRTYRDAAGEAVAVDKLAEWIGQRRWAALESPGLPAANADAVARRLGAIAAAVCSKVPVDGLILFGGDTARAVLGCLGIYEVEPCGEIGPGIPVSLAPYGGRMLAAVTKAGGFGPPDMLASIRGCLQAADGTLRETQE